MSCPECEKSLESKKWTQEWYAARFERLKDLAKERGCWPEMAAIIANGSLLTDSPPSYACLLEMAKHRANEAESALAGRRHLGWGDFEKVGVGDILRHSETFTLPAIVEYLLYGAKLLYHQHNYNGHHERLSLSIKAAEEWLDWMVLQSLYERQLCNTK